MTLKFPGGLAFSLLVASLGAATWFFTASPPMAKSPPGGYVSAPVEVRLDNEHVAHIFASSRADAAYALGVVHAQHRGGQLELAKRVIHGRLSEIVGPKTIEHDVQMRRMQLIEVARRQFAALPSDEQRILEAYARGVNAGVPAAESLWQKLPSLQGMQRLKWEGSDCIAWSLFLAFQLSGNWQTELDRWEAMRRLDWSEVMMLFTGTADRDVQLPPEIDSISVAQNHFDGYGGLPVQDARGSNVWAVTGQRSRSGLPLLANDPHLPLTAPSPWYLARISVSSEDPAERQDVIGATSPGMPMVLIGRTESVAWGITRNGADTQDLYVEEVDPSNDLRYRTEKGWVEFTHHTEQIEVRGATPVSTVVFGSRHGPIIGEVRPSHKDASGERKQRLALRWTALQPDASSISAALRVNQARNCNELIEAFRGHVAPVQNVMAADVNGHVCSKVVGRIPKRSAGHTGGGLVPVPGWADSVDWKTWWRYDEMPGFEDATNIGQDALANANQLLAQLNTKSPSGEWDLPFRHSRITQFLASKPQHDVASFQRLQYDTRSYEAAQLLPLLRGAKPQSDLAKAALTVISNFDGDMRADSSAALIYTAWTDELTRAVIGPRLGAAQFGALYGRRNFRAALHEILVDGKARAQWCATRDCTREISLSLSKAVEKLALSFGPDVHRWRWGQAHATQETHLMAGASFGVDELAETYEIGGDPWTASMTHYEPAEKSGAFPTSLGPNARFIYDLSDRNGSWFVQFGGPDEAFWSSANRRFAREWQEGRYSELRFEPRHWLERFTIHPQG